MIAAGLFGRAGPPRLARRRPLALVDLVWTGRTFTTLHSVLRTWAGETREPWPVIRLKLRYLGITSRKQTSPKTYRWQQHRPWTGELPAGSVTNTSLDGWVWHLLGNAQPKTAPTFPPSRWHQEELPWSPQAGPRAFVRSWPGSWPPNRPSTSLGCAP